MKCVKLLVMALIFLQGVSSFGQGVSGIYVGGPMYYGRDYSVRELKNSGFNTVIVWTIHINESGDLGFNGEFPLVKNGEYIGDQSYPEFRNDLKELKSATSSVKRIEFGLSAWQSGTYDHIKTFYEDEGFGPGTTIYENFKALIEAIPEIDAFNNDDEGTYDVESAVAFHTMLFDLGVNTAIVPYTNASGFWKPFVDDMLGSNEGSVDRLYLQVYAGGAGNDPCSSTWQSIGIPVYPGVWGEGSSSGNKNPQEVLEDMSSWKDECSINGGFMWLYDDFDNSDAVAEYAGAINEAFGIVLDQPIVAFDPSPTDLSVEISVDADLNWEAGGAGVTHTLYFGSTPTLTNEHIVYEGNTAKYDVGTLDNNMTYYWRVDQMNSGGSTTGDIWQFTTEAVTPLPEIVSAVYGDENPPSISSTPIISWEKSTHAVKYDVYFGDVTNPEFIRQTLDTFYIPSTLETNTYYYLRVDAINSAGTTTGNEWQLVSRGISLTDLSEVEASSSDADAKWDPANVIDGTYGNGDNGEWGAEDETNPWVQLDWSYKQAVGTIVLHDRAYYEENILNGTLSFSDGTSIQTGPLPVDGEGLAFDFERKDIEWVRFTIDSYSGSLPGLGEIEVFESADPMALPEKAITTEPLNETSFTEGSGITLRWKRGAYSETHSIYVSSDATIDPSDLVLEKSGDFHVVKGLGVGKYYWRIDENNKNGTTEGDMQSFEIANVLDTKEKTYQLVYPNPTNTSLTIQGDFNGPVMLQVYSRKGALVYEEQFSNHNNQITWELTNNHNQALVPGLYMLRILTADNIEVHKLIIND